MRTQIEILKEVKNLETYKTTVSEEIAEWIQGQGIDKLNGLECSSITINKGSEEIEETIETVKFVLDVDNDRMEKYLVENSLAHYEKITTTKVTLASKDKIRINSKRK